MEFLKSPGKAQHSARCGFVAQLHVTRFVLLAGHPPSPFTLSQKTPSISKDHPGRRGEVWEPTEGSVFESLQLPMNAAEVEDKGTSDLGTLGDPSLAARTQAGRWARGGLEQPGMTMGTVVPPRSVAKATGALLGLLGLI